MFIYKITNLLDGKLYIGQTTKTIEERWRAHINCARCKSQQYIHRAMRRYGVENFVMVPLIIVATQYELDCYEIKCIEQFKTYLPEIGYNLSFGGRFGAKHTEETRVKIGQSNIGKHSKPNSKETRERKRLARLGSKNPMFGKRRSQELKDKLRESMLGNTIWIGRHHSEESRRKLSEKAKERLKNPENHPMFGRKHSTETRLKISLLKRQRDQMKLINAGAAGVKGD